MKAELEMEIFFFKQWVFFKIFIFKLFFLWRMNVYWHLLNHVWKWNINLFVYQEYKMTQDLPFPIYFEIWETDIKISRFYNL